MNSHSIEKKAFIVLSERRRTVPHGLASFMALEIDGFPKEAHGEGGEGDFRISIVSWFLRFCLSFFSSPFKSGTFCCMLSLIILYDIVDTEQKYIDI